MQPTIPVVFAVAFLSLLSDSILADSNRPPEVVSRDSGEIEVRMAGGCVALYDHRGSLITRGSSCSGKDRSQANIAVSSYLREQGISDIANNPEHHDNSATTKGDFADELAGGPDFWQVAELANGDVLNLRTKPSAKASVIVGLQRGTVLRNHGCKIQAGQRWCQVSLPDDANQRGWVAGRFLRESSQ